MSSDHSDDTDDARTNLAAVTPQVAPDARQNAIQNLDLSRHGVGGDVREELWSRQYGGDRSLYKALGYVVEPRYEHFRARYERLDEAQALVDKLPQKAWATPEIRDPGAGDSGSAFEADVETLLTSDVGRFAETPLEPLSSGDDLADIGPALARGDTIDILERATRMDRLGEFSLVLLGLADAPAAEASGADGLAEPVDVGSLDGLDDLTYLEAYDEARMESDAFDLHQDWADSRYNTPEFYNVDLGTNNGSAKIHYSRVIHVSLDTFDDPLRSPSVLLQSLNRLDDIEKIQGASAEAFWRTAYQGIHAKPPQVNGQMSSFSDSGENLHNQIKRYYNNFQRAIFSGAEIETLDVSAEDPTAPLETKYRSLAAGHGVPQSILMGNETGERATQEDRRMWHELVSEFRGRIESQILRPLINRLIWYGILAPPEDGSYEVKWPPLDEPTEQERAETAKLWAQSIKEGTAGNPTMAVSMAEFREEVLDWKPERGSMADELPGDVMAPAESVDEMLAAAGVDSPEELLAQSDTSQNGADSAAEPPIQATDGGSETDG